jgi:hypothetical protein
MNCRPRHVSEEDFQRMRARVRKTGPVSAAADLQGIACTRKVSAVTFSPYKPYANKWEFNYAKICELEHRTKQIQGWKYGGITFTLSKGQYHLIDFLIWHLDGSIELAQIKGYHPNLRAGIKGLKWAAQLHPWFVWTIKWWTGRAWDGEYVKI